MILFYKLTSFLVWIILCLTYISEKIWPWNKLNNISKEVHLYLPVKNSLIDLVMNFEDAGDGGHAFTDSDTLGDGLLWTLDKDGLLCRLNTPPEFLRLVNVRDWPGLTVVWGIFHHFYPHVSTWFKTIFWKFIEPKRARVFYFFDTMVT